MLKSGLSPIGMNFNVSLVDHKRNIVTILLGNIFMTRSKLSLIKTVSLKFIHSVIWKSQNKPHDAIVFKKSCSPGNFERQVTRSSAQGYLPIPDILSSWEQKAKVAPGQA